MVNKNSWSACKNVIKEFRDKTMELLQESTSALDDLCWKLANHKERRANVFTQKENFYSFYIKKLVSIYSAELVVIIFSAQDPTLLI